MGFMVYLNYIVYINNIVYLNNSPTPKVKQMVLIPLLGNWNSFQDHSKQILVQYIYTFKNISLHFESLNTSFAMLSIWDAKLWNESYKKFCRKNSNTVGLNNQIMSLLRLRTDYLTAKILDFFLQPKCLTAFFVSLIAHSTTFICLDLSCVFRLQLPGHSIQCIREFCGLQKGKKLIN